MTVRRVPFAIDEYYHLYSRGVDKRAIFLDDEDRKRFIRLMFVCNGTSAVVYREVKRLPLSTIENGEKVVAIGAYCLMSNHFHILVRETVEGGTVKFMSKLLTAYSSYFNKKYKRTGPLFSGEFKSSHIDNDEYLKYMFAYIHLNPLKIMDTDWRERTINMDTAKRFLDNYQFSSYFEYLEKNRDESCILNKAVFPKYFEHKDGFSDYLYDWLNFDSA